MSGQVTTLPLDVAATGPISCTTDRGNPARAILDTQYSIVGGAIVPSGGGKVALPFYSDGKFNLLSLASCGAAWDTKPTPYRVSAVLAIAPDTPAGNYTLPIKPGVTNPGVAGFAPLADNTPNNVSVTVVDAPAPGLPAPRENRSVNLYPGKKVTLRYPRSKKVVRVTEPIQAPIDINVNAEEGFVDVESDRDALGNIQRARFWKHSFSIAYTRAVTPGPSRSAQRSSRPITELTVARSCARGARASATRSGRFVARSSRRRRRRGLFGRGKGRFRTRGSYGAGTVRGTYWYFEAGCGKDLIEVFSGVVRFRDFGLRRTIDVRRGQGYIAIPPNRKKGSSTG